VGDFRGRGNVSDVRQTEKKQLSWLTGVLKVNDAPGSFRLARTLQPNLQRLVIFEDTINSVRAQQQSIQEACAAETPNMRIELLKTENIQQILTAVESLLRGTAVLITRARLARQFMAELRA